ncbi:hypothetical protein MUK42_11747 [Musa troglodytarum]|uniref:CST complex subunit TEN1 n=1 Tax=Musa troglodytarum TaxID=320322 RepID=A0A9E7GQZ7_9LILI|nr:hypothetical protein MUK42_11747 [Musa troglodytarum]URE16803.1 hypothetical protein MUK42_11747 [Musa troglodytarum]
MAACSIKPGIPVILKELEQGSHFFHQGASLRVTGKLQEYSVDTAIAVITEADVSFKIDTQHLRDLTFRIGSYYQFIGELLVFPEDSAILQARVGRNVDGLDINLYHRSLQLRRQFEVELMNSRVT